MDIKQEQNRVVALAKDKQLQLRCGKGTWTINKLYTSINVMRQPEGEEHLSYQIGIKEINRIIPCGKLIIQNKKTDAEIIKYVYQPDGLEGYANDDKQTLKKSEITKNSDNYTFDGKYFENIETIGVFSPIINLKNAVKQENEEENKKCVKILENDHPQLQEFMNKNFKSFDNFFKLHNNALLTLTEKE